LGPPEGGPYVRLKAAPTYAWRRPLRTPEGGPYVRLKAAPTYAWRRPLRTRPARTA